MSPSSETENPEFWHRQAFEALAARVAESADAIPDTALTDEQDALLWAFAEQDLSESDTEQVSKLVTQIPQAMRRLDEIHQAIEETAVAKTGDPAKAWARLNARATPVKAASPIGIFDMVLRFVEDGLELLTTTGSAAYAPALARSGDTAPQTTAALEFLTSIGTVQLVVDHITDDCCNLTVRPTRLTGRLNADELTLEIRDATGTALRSEPFDGGRARTLDLPCGAYRIVFIKDFKELASITCDLRSRS